MLVGCTSDGTAPSEPAEISSIPSRERSTGDIIETIAASDDGTLTRVDVSLMDRLEEAKSVELVDGDYLVMSLGDSQVVLERAERQYDFETMIHYVAEVARTDLAQIGVDLRRSDGSVAHSTVSIPRSFEITDVAPTVRAGDVVEVDLAPMPDAEVWGIATIQCDGVDHRPNGTFHYAGDGTPPQAGIPAAKVPAGASSCDANLTISIGSRTGSYDAALGNVDNDETLGQQQRTTRVRYYP